MSISEKKEGVKIAPAPSKSKNEQLKTEVPLSEKDEVKKAEDRMNRITRKK